MANVLFVGIDIAPFHLAFDADTLAPLPDGSDYHGALTAAVYALALSADESLQAVTQSNTALKVYNTSDWSPVTITSGIPGGSGYACAFNPAGTQLAVGNSLAPYLTVFNISDWSKLTITGGVPTARAYGAAYNPAGTLLAAAVDATPYLIVYNTADWSKVTLTGGNPAGSAKACAFNPAGTLLAVGHDTSPYLTVYNTADWSKVTLTGGNPAGKVNSCKFSPDGSKLAVGHANSPYLTVYNTADWSKVTLTGGNPIGQVYGVSWSSDGARLATAHYDDPVITTYNTSTWAKIALTGADPFELYAIGKACVFTSTMAAKHIKATGAAAVLDDLGAAAVRTVRVYHRATGALIGETTTDVAGQFDMGMLLDGEKQVVYLDDVAGTLYNDLIHRVLPG
jgi:WD40 repeat protein